MSKAHKPVNFLADMAEEALEEAKEFVCKKEKSECKEIENIEVKCGEKEDENILRKNAVNIFGESVRWNSYKKIRDDLFNKLNNYETTKELKTTFLYRLIELSQMSKNVKFNNSIKDTIWKSKLNYIYTRNISNKDFELLEFLNDTIEKYPKEFKVVLFEYIYKRRS